MWIIFPDFWLSPWIFSGGSAVFSQKKIFYQMFPRFSRRTDESTLSPKAREILSSARQMQTLPSRWQIGLATDILSRQKKKLFNNFKLHCEVWRKEVGERERQKREIVRERLFCMRTSTQKYHSLVPGYLCIPFAYRITEVTFYFHSNRKHWSWRTSLRPMQVFTPARFTTR